MPNKASGAVNPLTSHNVENERRKKVKKAFGIIGAVLFLVTVWVGSVLAAEQVFFYHTDPAGTPLAMTDSTGKVVWKADYKPFGQEQSVTATTPNDKRFVGKEKDEETGLSYFGARYQDAKTGRFISPDQVRAVDPKTSKTNEKLLLNPQGLNTYAYALNNPYRYVDPDGHNPILIAAGLIWLGEMIMPQTMGSSQRDSFIDRHWGDLMMAGTGLTVEKVGANVISGIAKSSRIMAAGREVQLSEHALQRMAQRGISQEQIQNTMTQSPFKFYHDGAWKTGYYDQSTKILIAESKNTITTVINNVKPNYVNNLKNLRP